MAIENIIIDNVLSEQDIIDIYTAVLDTPEDMTVTLGFYGQKNYMTPLPEHVKYKILKKAEEVTGKKLIAEAISFARYSKKYGTYPQLYPHVDEAFKQMRYTFDLQLGSNFDWPLVVENNSFTLKNNQALLFSGTHQVHWRQPIEVHPNQFMDMIFCHLYEEGSAELSSEHWEHMYSKIEDFNNGYKDQADPNIIVTTMKYSEWHRKPSEGS